MNESSEESNMTTSLPTMEPKSTIEVLSAVPRVAYWWYVYMSVGLVGILLNTLAVRVLQDFPNSNFYFYLKCLSSFDLAFDIFIVAGGIKNTMFMLMKYHWFAWFFAYVQPFLLNTMAVCSTYTTVWMSIERFFVIQFPLRTRNWFTKRTARTAIFVIVGCLATFQIRYFWYTTLTLKYHPDTGALYYTGRSEAFYAPIFVQLRTVGSFLLEWIPALFLLVSNITIIISLINASRKRHQMQNQQTAKNFKKELKVTIVLLCIVLLFLTLEAPVNIAYVFTHLSMTPCIHWAAIWPLAA